MRRAIRQPYKQRREAISLAELQRAPTNLSRIRMSTSQIPQLTLLRKTSARCYLVFIYSQERKKHCMKCNLWGKVGFGLNLQLKAICISLFKIFLIFLTGA